jgi:hypothetical protein
MAYDPIFAILTIFGIGITSVISVQDCAIALPLWAENIDGPHNSIFFNFRFTS